MASETVANTPQKWQRPVCSARRKTHVCAMWWASTVQLFDSGTFFANCTGSWQRLSAQISSPASVPISDWRPQRLAGVKPSSQLPTTASQVT